MSHIIPKSLFKLVQKNGQHRAVRTMNGETAEQNSHAERLLCRACDNSFSEIERYAAGKLGLWTRTAQARYEAFRDKGLMPEPLPISVEVDYTKVKLFLLLMAWRASLARGPFFCQVGLSPVVMEALRLALLAKDPGPLEFCPIIATVDSRLIPAEVIAPPSSMRIGGYSEERNVFHWQAFSGTLTLIACPQYLPLDSDLVSRSLNEIGRLPITLEDSHGPLFDRIRRHGNPSKPAL